MSTAEFKHAAQEYLGLDLVSEVLGAEVSAGVNVLEHSKLLARRLAESKEDHPEYFEKTLDQIAGDIDNAQRRLAR